MNEPQLLLRADRFRVERVSQARASGTTFQRDVIRHPGAVCILPLLEGPEEQSPRVCLIRNHRVAVGRELVELPAGTLEPGEDPLETARRELAEETGYRAARVEPLTEFYMSPGILDERMFVVLATGLSPGPTDLQPDERIEPLVMSYDEALEMAIAGRIEDAKTLAALLWYEAARRAN